MYKTIGILTGGGDAPGLNAVIRAVVKTASKMALKDCWAKRGPGSFLKLMCEVCCHAAALF
jgi:6-phosphofructokinase 1